MSESVTLTIEAASDVKYTGVVAYLRMPINLRAFSDLEAFIELSYGKGCVGSEMNGWLEIRKETTGDNNGE